jgi:protein-S-isoprenylcysteine O-methyltransferase Ste14
MATQVKQVLIALLQSLAILVAVVLVALRFREDSWNWLNVAGLALAVPSVALWATARIQLGASFAVRAKANSLVAHGIYSRIRNPIYVFGTLFLAGLVLVMGRPGWLLALLIMVPMQVWRAHKEARVLEEKFGDAYRAYRQQTWF